MSPFLLTVALWAGCAEAATIEDVRSAGMLQCGVDEVVPGFSARKVDGRTAGLAPDFCRAVALAVFGDAAKVNITVLKAEERVEALQSGEVDVLVAAVPISADVELRDGLMFGEPIYFSAVGEAYAPLVRQGDDEWFAALRWVRHVWIAGKPLAEGAAFSFAPDWQRQVAATGGYAASHAGNFGHPPALPNLPVAEGGWLWVPGAQKSTGQSMDRP